jgi:hypothetical protein
MMTSPPLGDATTTIVLATCIPIGVVCCVGVVVLLACVAKRNRRNAATGGADDIAIDGNPLYQSRPTLSPEHMQQNQIEFTTVMRPGYVDRDAQQQQKQHHQPSSRPDDSQPYSSSALQLSYRDVS